MASFLRFPSFLPSLFISDLAISVACATSDTKLNTGLYVSILLFKDFISFSSLYCRLLPLTVAFRVAISYIQQVLIPFVGIRDIWKILLLLVIVNEPSTYLF